MELNFRIMRKIYRYILAVAAIAAAASCAENLAPESLVPENPNPESPVADNEVMPETLVSMVFTTSVDDQLLNPDVASKTTYGSRKVYWEETDNITVFSLGETGTVKTDFGVKTLSDDKTTATFEGLADAQASAFYAVYPHHADNACDSGVLTVNLPSEQTAVANGFASGANVSVAYSENNGENAFKFRNATTLLCIKFIAEDDAVNTKSITFKAKKNETEYMGLAGQSQITLDSENVPVVSEGNVQQVTLLAPEGGFVKDVIYYVPVYAVGECAGFEVTFTDLNDDDYTKTKNVPGSLDRNWLFNFGSIPGPYDTLPKEFTVEFDFSNNNWPFSGKCEYVSSSGETYTYTYTYDYNGQTKSVEWSLKMGNKAYELTDNGLFNSAANSFIMQLPAVKNRYLSRVAVLMASYDENTRVALQSKWANAADGQSCLLPSGYVTAGTEVVVDFYSNCVLFSGQYSNKTPSYTYLTSDRPNFTPALGRQYYLKLRDKGVISKITLTYSINAPGEAPAE